MKPKTRLQIDVFNRSKQLNPEKQMMLKWAEKHWLEHRGYATKSRVVCMDCSARFSPDLVKNGKATCPECNTKLIVEQGRTTTFSQSIYAAYAMIEGDYQVVRYFHIGSFTRSGKHAQYWCSEILQHWICDNEKYETVARLHTTNWYCDSWSGDMAIRKEYGHERYYADKYDIYTENFHPKSEFKPQYDRYGINKNMGGLTVLEAIRHIPKEPKMETLLKAGQFSLLTRYLESSGDIRSNWSSIKICMRNKYLVKDASIWIDYLNLLRYFQKDLSNAFYVCPADLKEVHDKLVKKKREIEERRASIRRQEELERDMQEFIKQKSKFFDLVFSHGNIIIKPLQSIDDFKKEGDILHHCVYTNHYYRKPESLIMSARIDDKPIETIEVSLKTMDIVQSRGLLNKDSEYHDQIVQIVRKNIDAIAQKKSTKRTKKAAA